MTGKGSNPNSKEALRQSVAKRKKNAKKANLTLSPEAIASLDRIATHLGITRSGLVERLARAGDERIMEVLEESEESRHPTSFPQ